MLHRLFPHQGIPHQVWIRDGRVIAITGGEYATAENIRAALAGTGFQFKAKRAISLEKDQPLFINGNGGTGEQLLYQSALSTRLPADISGTSRRQDRILAYNVPLEDLYFQAFSEIFRFHDQHNRLLLEVSDTLRQRIIWEKSSTLTGDYATDAPFRQLDGPAYVLLQLDASPRAAPEVLNAIMLEDLNRLFGQTPGIRGSLQRRKVDCLVLVRTTRRDLLASTGGAAQRNADEQQFELLEQALPPAAERPPVREHVAAPPHRGRDRLHGQHRHPPDSAPARSGQATPSPAGLWPGPAPRTAQTGHAGNLRGAAKVPVKIT